MKDLFIYDAPHAKKYSSVERLEIGDQYKAQSWPLVGQVTDRVIPANIGDYGLCSDGAWHVDAGNRNKGKLRVDTTRHDPVIEIEDWKIRTGLIGSYEEHLVGHWKMDDNLATTVLIDETGNTNGILSGGNNTEDLSQTDAIKGKALLTDGVVDTIDLPESDTWRDEFTVMIASKPNFSYTSGDETLWAIGNGDEVINFYYQGANDRYILRIIQVGNINTYLYYDPSYASDNDFKQYNVFHLCFNFTEGYISLAVNGLVVDTATIAGTMWDVVDPIDRHRMGLDCVAAVYGSFFIDLWFVLHRPSQTNRRLPATIRRWAVHWQW